MLCTYVCVCAVDRLSQHVPPTHTHTHTHTTYVRALKNVSVFNCVCFLRCMCVALVHWTASARARMRMRDAACMHANMQTHTHLPGPSAKSGYAPNTGAPPLPHLWCCPAPYTHTQCVSFPTLGVCAVLCVSCTHTPKGTERARAHTHTHMMSLSIGTCVCLFSDIIF